MAECAYLNHLCSNLHTQSQNLVFRTRTRVSYRWPSRPVTTTARTQSSSNRIRVRRKYRPLEKSIRPAAMLGEASFHSMYSSYSKAATQPPPTGLTTAPQVRTPRTRHTRLA